MTNIHNKEHVNGYHPDYKHLVWFDIEPHYGSYILTTPAKKGSMLVSYDDLCHMYSEDMSSEMGGYAVDDYLDLIKE